jgi:MFS-type transporter involved in bile tolerance (Atg22 family)
MFSYLNILHYFKNSTVVGLVVAICLPIVGAILDHTSFRKKLGQYTALIQICLVSTLCFISENNWFVMVVVQVFSTLVGWVHTLVIFAYLPELTSDPKILIKWTANFHLLQYVFVMVFLPSMVAVLYFLGYTNNEIMSARIATGTSLAISTILFGWTWTRLMEPRGTLQTLPEGASLRTIGFIRVWTTAKEICQNYRQLMWFFMSVCLVEAAQSSLAVISLTYMTDKLQMTVTENGIGIFILFAFSAVGTLIGAASIKVMNPIRSNQLCQLFTVGATTTAVFLLTGPGQQNRAYVIAALWGIGAGWKITVERFAVTQIIPKSQDAEMMGFYLFASQVLIWCPTLIYTTLNEAGYDARIGVALLNVFFLGGFVCLSLMGSYDDAKLVGMRRTSEIGDSPDINMGGLDDEKRERKETEDIFIDSDSSQQIEVTPA